MTSDTASSAAKFMTALLGAVSLITVAAAWAADPVYDLTYDKDKWSEDFSVFRMAVNDPVGSMKQSFATSDDPRLRPLTRLDTSFSFSTPLVGSPGRFGDTVSSAGLWSQPVRMGGLQFGTMQPVLPDIVAPPMLLSPDLGPNVNPATVASNRIIEQVHTAAQLQKQSLIAPGQAVYSVESGLVRQDFELRSNSYGSWLTSGTYRYGLNASTTVDGQFAQVGSQQSVFGIGLLEGLGPLGQLSARLASSHDVDSNGWLAHWGYDYVHDNLSLALRSHVQSPGYQDVGDSAYLEPLRQRTLASAGMNLGALGKVSVASATQTFSDDSRSNVVAVSHAMPLLGGGIVSTSAAYAPGQFTNTAWLVSFTFPFNYEMAPARKLAKAADMVLDKTMSDAFNMTRVPSFGHIITDRLQLQ
jgi:outer membrane usher protein FimD/PapC